MQFQTSMINNNERIGASRPDQLMQEEEKQASISNDILSEDGGGPPRKNVFEEALGLGASNLDEEPPQLDPFLMLNRATS